MNGYFYTVTYSFNSDRHAVGPFQTWDEAWVAMLKDAEKKKRIDREENGWTADLCVDEETGKITLSNFFADHEDVTAWLLFDSMEA